MQFMKSLTLKNKKKRDNLFQTANSYELDNRFWLFTGSKCGRDEDKGVVTVK